MSQIVSLGAGYDGRAYRFKDLAGDTRIFEFDARPTQVRKMKSKFPAEPLSRISLCFSAGDCVQVPDKENGYEENIF